MASHELKPGIRPFGLGVIACVLIIGQVGALALEEACEVCHCDSVERVVDCNNKRLTELPIGIPNDTVKLHLNGNFLRKIPEDWLLQFYQLENLVLSSNLISEPFAVPPSLRALNASDNRLEDIGLIMKTGYGLEGVCFDKNKLEVIRPDTFENCRNLQALFVSSNLISEPFAVPSSLRVLYADDNQLEDIGLIMKTGIGLEEVTLDKNKLEVIRPDTFGNCRNLNKLFVSSNLISEPFAVPSSLRVLVVENNQLEDIGLIMKTGCGLEKVFFEENKLEVIRPDTFGNCSNLQTLGLDNNLISEPFAVPSSLKNLNIRNNQLEDIGLIMKTGYGLEFANFAVNKLEVIRPDTFANCRNLKILELGGNFLREIPEDLLMQCYNLESLDVESNLISKPFAVPSSLQTLIVDDNHLKDIGLIMKTGYSLIEVYFAENKLEDIRPDTFGNCINLRALSFAANKLNDETLPKDLLVNLTTLWMLDLSRNELTKFPVELLRTLDKLKDLFIQRNHITVLDETMFKGLHSLETLFIFQNPITQLADFQFYETNLQSIVMFQCNISEVGTRPFATKGNTINQILMYGNPIEHIKDTIWQDLAPDCYVSIDKSLQQVPNMNRTDLVVDLVGEDFIRPFETMFGYSPALSSSGLVCLLVPDGSIFRCTPCRQGYYGLKLGCTPCLPGGFYQHKTGQGSDNKLMNCQKCKNGTYVSPEAHPGRRDTDCNSCPTGTNKSTTAGFRACPCVDNYYRTDRFGECHQCPLEGINCSGEYQHLLPGYWWTWNWTSQQKNNDSYRNLGTNITSQQENHDSYRNFVTNITTENESYNINTQRFDGKLPQVHKCPRADTCPNGGIGIDTNCSAGYTGWLCSECAKNYYSWLGYCIECPGWPLFAAEVFCILLVVCIVVGFFVWDAYRRHRQNERNIVNVFLARGKIVVGFCQVMGEIFSALDEIPWPNTLQKLGSFFKTLEVSIVGWLISPRCFIPDFTYPNIYIEFLLGFSFIISVVVFAFCYYGFRKCHLTAKGLTAPHLTDDLSKSKRRCFLIVVILLFLSYPSVCSVIITLLPTGCSLYYLDEDKTFNVTLLRYDYAVVCDSPRHSIYNDAAETAMVYVVGFPVVLFLLLWSSKLSGEGDRAPVASLDSDQELPHNPHRMINDTDDHVTESEATVSTIKSATKIGWESFLCENYKAEFWYWEIVELSRKVLQTLFLLLFGPEDHFTLFASVVLSVFFLLIHAYLKPMKDAAEQRLQMCSLGTIFLNMLAASLLLMPNDTGSDGEFKKGILAITLVLLNLSVIGIVGFSSIWTAIKALSKHRCFDSLRNFVTQINIWSQRRSREQDGNDARTDDGNSPLLETIEEKNEQTSGNQDAASGLSFISESYDQVLTKRSANIEVNRTKVKLQNGKKTNDEKRKNSNKRNNKGPHVV